MSGVSAGGLITTPFPAASAGASLRVIIAAGKFHGVTITTTPTGGWCTMIRLAPEGAVLIEPWMRTASSEFQRKNSAAYATSPIASDSGLPCSRTISSASSD